MTMVDWYVEGIEFGNCNCDYGCPCQFESRPSHGHCRGFEVVRIDRGHFGEVPLNGLCAALLYAWPGAIYEGNGAMQAVIDERADAAQRQALATILHGGETQDAVQLGNRHRDARHRCRAKFPQGARPLRDSGWRGACHRASLFDGLDHRVPGATSRTSAEEGRA